jgi:hypothetical protein
MKERKLYLLHLRLLYMYVYLLTYLFSRACVFIFQRRGEDTPKITFQQTSLKNSPTFHLEKSLSRCCHSSPFFTACCNKDSSVRHIK